MNWLWFSLIIVICYFIGNLNFSRLLVKWVKHEDITTKGSGNPGFTNVLRNYGIGLALAVLVCEILKVGVPCLVSGYLLAGEGLFEVAYFTAGVAVVLGVNFPVVSKFKGGKGIACTVGLFLFSPLWYVALFMCVVYILIMYFLDYGVIGSLVFVSAMSIAWIIYLSLLKPAYWYVVLVIVIIMWLLAIFMHRSNIARLVKGSENHTGFKDKLKRLFSKKEKVEKVDEKPEKEIVVEEETKQGGEKTTESDNDLKAE